MGANASSISLQRTELDDIPESCIALVLSYLDPPEIAKLAGVNRAFRAASSADFIWIPKLPSTSPYLISKLCDRAIGGSCRKDIYASLCRHTTLDGGTKEVWIDKRTGGVCLAISSKAMAITGIDDRRYWNHIPTHESRFETVACLEQIWWLEVDGEVEFRYPRGTYSLFFRLKLGRVGKQRLSRVHGWDTKPAQFQLKTHDGQHAASRCTLGSLGNWVHYHVGDFVVEDPNAFTTINFSLTQIDCTHTKGGLCVDSVLICPTSVGKELLYRG
ncbi:F-box protein PP2-A13-like [Salvia miltiorrhiza]|uniref:F-box protein PP2-A13-like n=1 Tax=Salvia miltiorrhiza TaxID=226208 RepID=UPI0025AB90FB|nr:F-box protein PP2-A13-like [Salvia miltiorrhiza]